MTHKNKEQGRAAHSRRDSDPPPWVRDTTPLYKVKCGPACGPSSSRPCRESTLLSEAGDRNRTGDQQLGKLMLMHYSAYQRHRTHANATMESGFRYYPEYKCGPSVGQN